MQQVTLKNTRVLFAAALPMNNHIVNKTRVLIGAKVAPQFEKMIQKEYEQMQRMRYFDPHRSAYIPIQLCRTAKFNWQSAALRTTAAIIAVRQSG